VLHYRVSRLPIAVYTCDCTNCQCLLGSAFSMSVIDATGDSLASLMANGNGEIKVAMAGGDLSGVLVDLSGLEFGNALLSARGIPNKTQVQCFVGGVGLRRGTLEFKARTLETGEAITDIGGDLDLSKETIDLALKTDAKHFSIGALPTRIGISISGTSKDPKIGPVPKSQLGREQPQD
jgi:AsmA family protein